MNLEFGCDLHNVLFDLNNDELYTEALQTVEEAVAKWMPYIQLEQFEVATNDDDKDRYKAKVYISYSLKENSFLKDEVLLQF